MDQEIWRVLVGIQEVLSCATLPSAIYKPELIADYSRKSWTASYGGVRAIGNSPAAAMSNFDRKWYECLP